MKGVFPLPVYIDTCVLPRSRLETAELYRKRFGTELGFELLMMFDLPDWEENLKRNLSFFSQGSLIFHEPVWGVEHTAARGSVAWEESMFHIRLTQKYAQVLRPSDMVYHLNNGIIPDEKRDTLLKTSLENLKEMRDLFPDVRLLVENTGIRSENTSLLDQNEFTDLCRDQYWDILIDVGHANANHWDLFRLVHDLRDQIRGFHLHNNNGKADQHNRIHNGSIDFDRLLPFLKAETPEALWILEYTRPEYHGEPLMEDIDSCYRL